MGKRGGARSSITNPALQYSFDNEEEKAQYLTAAMTHALSFQKMTKVKNDEEAQQRIAAYFLQCAQQGMRPIWEECALCLGVTRQALWDWETGKYNAPISVATIKRTREILAAFDARAAVENKMNPVLYFFRAKNYYGMRDQTEYLLTPNTEQPDTQKLIRDAELLPEE